MNEEIQEQITKIGWKVESIDDSINLLIKGSRKEILGEVLAFFGRNYSLMKVFLNVDREKNVLQLSQTLKMKPPNVLRELSKLKKEGLIEIVRTGAGGNVYRKKVIDDVLQLSVCLLKRFPSLIEEAPKKVTDEQTEVSTIENNTIEIQNT